METNNGLTFHTMEKLLSGQDDLIQNVKDLARNRNNNIWIIGATLESLSDKFKPLAGMSPATVALMARMLVRFNKSSLKASIDNDLDFKFKDMIKYIERSVYWIDIGGTHRIASITEVRNGVMELENKPEKAIEDAEIERLMYLLTWAVTGLYRYYMRAGFTCTYRDNKLVETDCQQIIAAMHALREVADWLDEDIMYEKAKNEMLKMKKMKDYRYPDVVVDEIKPECSMKSVIWKLSKSIPYTTNPILLKCKGIIKRCNSNNDTDGEKLPTDDKIILRKGYNIITHIDGNMEQAGLSESEKARVTEIKYACDKIDKAVNSGRLEKSSWGYKIKTTIASNKYLRCSDKQFKILKETCEKLDNDELASEQAKRRKEAAGQDIEDFDLGNLSNLLGEGRLRDGSDSL